MSTTKTVLERIALALEELVADRKRAEAFNEKTHSETKARIAEFQALYARQMQSLLDEQAKSQELMAEQERRLQAYIGMDPAKPAVLFDISDAKKPKG